MYSCLNITCSDIGGLKSTHGVYPGTEECDDSSILQAAFTYSTEPCPTSTPTGPPSATQVAQGGTASRASSTMAPTIAAAIAAAVVPAIAVALACPGLTTYCFQVAFAQESRLLEAFI